ncbi:MAG: PAS domain S-box protein [Bdellovibrionaceae bacterium]|nr:PAS domain S-box protein [Pseudobdellovibrionaceae bacterium]
MLLARDVMTLNPLCLSAESDIQDAIRFFLKIHISSAPVINARSEILGQLDELSLMRAFVKHKVQQEKTLKVSDFSHLFSEPQFVSANAPLSEVLTSLIQCPLHRVLVRGGNGGLVGIISPKDVLRALDDKTRPEGTLPAKLRELETNVQKLDVQLQNAEKSLGQYDQLFAASPYMMHSVDRTGKVVMANPALHAFLGYAPGELVGKSVFEIYPKTLHEVVRKSLDQIIQEGRHDLTYSSFQTQAGRAERVEVVSSSIKDDQGRFIGTLTLSRPVDSDALLRSLHGVLEKDKK